VGIAAVRAGSGRLQVTVSAQVSANVTLQAVRFGAASGALIDAGPQTGATGNFPVALPAGTQQFVFFVRPTAVGQAATVPLVVTDSCGDWSTFVGAGAGSL